jgi:para-nitrobenzyl esterase
MSYNVKKPRKPLRPFAGFHIILYFCTYMKKMIISLMGLLVFAIAAPAQEENNVVVNTTLGQVSGIMQEGTMAYLGIPYAKVERFMPPQPVTPWEGIRACDHWGPMVMQQTWGKQLSEDEMSEQNSCVLNVWTTDVNAHRPVMLWLHGGGFDSGTSEWDPGMQLAKKDVVVVSVNHRLNILGFLDLSAVSPDYKYSGNVGMLDVVQALEWIRDNIARFGGDPTNVTIFGESGGGGKVGTLLCMPAAHGLFHKAIIMSGTILNVNNHEMTQTLGKAVMQELGITDIEALKQVPYQTLYDAGQRAMAASIGTRKPGTPMMWGFGPTPDGEVLLQQPFQPNFAAISDSIPILIGTTFNELQRLHYQRPLMLDEAKKELEPTFGEDTDAYVEAFAKTYPDYTPQDLLSIDWLFRPKTIITADAIAESRQAPTYTYMFTWRSPLNNGSIHGHELKFCFNTLHRAKNDLPSPTEDDLKLADLMSSVWAQFAHNGNPNIPALPAWQPYTAENGEIMIFNHCCEIRHNPDRLLEEIINRHCFKQLDAFRGDCP